MICCKKELEIDTDMQAKQQQILNNLDSIYVYAQQIYLWHEALPTLEKFNPRQFYASTKDELFMYKHQIFALTRFPQNLETNNSYEYNRCDPFIPKYATIIPKSIVLPKFADHTALSGTINQAFGLSFAYNDLGASILTVDANSTAGRSGLKRGFQILAINDHTFDNVNMFYRCLNNAIQASFMKLSIFDPANGTRQVRLSASHYEPNPVLRSSVIHSKGRKIGYIAYSNFTPEKNTIQFMDPVFQKFENTEISELIIDLRYNAGGYQQSVNYLANRIAPSTVEGSVMYSEHYNALMQAGKATILKNQFLFGAYNQPLFHKSNPATLFDIDYSVAANTVFFNATSLNNKIQTVYFIVSEYTASASELLINVLKPHMQVKLIGVSTKAAAQVRTYGKPVGFFPIDIKSYNLYLPMYQLKNAKGDGHYFNGFLADYTTIDDYTSDFGSLTDPAIDWICGERTQHANTEGLSINKRRLTNSPTYIFQPKYTKLIKETQSFKLKAE